MIDPLLIIPILASFLVPLFLMPFWIKKARSIGLLWEDMNKYNSGKVAGSGGVIVVLGFVIGVLLFVGYHVFVFGNSLSMLVELFALLSVVLLLSGVGIVDDLFGWQHGGLSRRSRIILCAMAAIPLMAIHAGDSVIELPFFGIVNLDFFYPLVIIPLGIVGATTTFNFLAGFNGLEAGQGILLLGASAIVAYFIGVPWLAVVLLCMIVALAAFLLFNFSPASVFPGDSLTYAVGGLIAMACIIGNFEKIAVFFFIPYIIEFGLKLRGKLQKHSFGKPLRDGTLELKYDKLYGLEHVAIWFLNKTGMRATEKKVVYCVWIFQIVIIILGFVIFRKSVFGIGA